MENSNMKISSLIIILAILIFVPLFSSKLIGSTSTGSTNTTSLYNDGELGSISADINSIDLEDSVPSLVQQSKSERENSQQGRNIASEQTIDTQWQNESDDLLDFDVTQ